MTLGQGIKINGNVRVDDCVLSDGIKIFGEFSDKLLIGKYNTELTADGEKPVSSIPAIERYAKYLYRPVGLED